MGADEARSDSERHLLGASAVLYGGGALATLAVAIVDWRVSVPGYSASGLTVLASSALVVSVMFGVLWRLDVAMAPWLYFVLALAGTAVITFGQVRYTAPPSFGPMLLLLPTLIAYAFLPRMLSVLLMGWVGSALAFIFWTQDGWYPPINYWLFVAISVVTVTLVVSQLVERAEVQTRRANKANDELRTVNATLERAHSLIRRYVPEQVVDAVLSDTAEAIEHHERRKLTIFFSDLVGFTDLSDEMEPEDLAKVLHDYFTEMAAIAKKHDGTVDDLVGDAILVFFGAPDFTDDRDQALRAVRMAVEMQEAMGALNERWTAAGIPETLTVRMGVNTGVATVGNFGSAERTKFTALGKQVNIAARIQSKCEPGKVLIGHTTWLLVRDEITCTAKGELVLKGLRKPMPAYEVKTTLA